MSLEETEINYALEMDYSDQSVAVNYSNGDIILFDYSLNQKNVVKQGVVSLCQENQIFYAIKKNGSVVIIDERQNTTPILFEQKGVTLDEPSLCCHDFSLGIGMNEILKIVDVRTGKITHKIDEIHSDNIVDLVWWNNYFVTASQDGLSCIIDYEKRNEGIIDTINFEKPISSISILTNEEMSLQSDDNGIVLYSFPLKKITLEIDDIRDFSIQNIDEKQGASVLRSINWNGKTLFNTTRPDGVLLITEYEGEFKQFKTIKKHSALIRDIILVGGSIYTTSEDGSIQSTLI